MARKALLLRVGIDRGTGGVLSPIFADGTFEYVPIPEEGATRYAQTFGTMPAGHGQTLAAFVPGRIAGKHPHLDPDFGAFVYGDAALNKRRQLLRLETGDLLVFYAGFEPWPKDDIPRLFVTGFLEVRRVHSLSADRIAGDPHLRRRFGKTAHFLRDPPDSELALVEGDEHRSHSLRHALPLGDGEDRMLRDLAALGYEGSLRRSVGHWFQGSGLAALEDWLRHGPVSLVGGETRLYIAAAVKIQPADRHRGELVIDAAQAAVGDWVYCRTTDDTFTLARINGRSSGEKARASLYWHFVRLSPAALDLIPNPGPATPPELRRLVDRISAHHRMGTHALCMR
jgi:hypothetical protein